MRSNSESKTKNITRPSPELQYKETNATLKTTHPDLQTKWTMLNKQLKAVSQIQRNKNNSIQSAFKDQRVESQGNEFQDPLKF